MTFLKYVWQEAWPAVTGCLLGTIIAVGFIYGALL